jgi:hypothetical protein
MNLETAIDGLKIAPEEHDKENTDQASIEGGEAEHCAAIQTYAEWVIGK